MVTPSSSATALRWSLPTTPSRGGNPGPEARLGSLLLPHPIDMLPYPLVGEELLPRVVAPAQDLLIGDEVVDAVVAGPAEPEAAAPHLLDREPVAEPPF